MQLYNTLTRKLEEFEPINPDLVGVYTCGPTVYHHAHIGNLRTYIASDVLVRVLNLAGYRTKHVMNITDVGHLVTDADEGEDKMAVGAAREGVTAWEIAERYTASFFEQCAAMNIRKPKVVCRATDHIPQQIAMIESLERQGYAYSTNDGVYFDTERMPSYGTFARLDLEGLRGGARVDMGEKRNKTDFALWKFCRPDEARQMEWNSPWGRGFPGWHIECSAMSTFYLGDQFDIHTGGIDHIPIHHTNEIAQSECATGLTPFVRYWMHSNFLNMGANERMAKSSGEFSTAFTLLEKGFNPLAFRLLCLKAHYRKGMKFTWDSLEGASVQYRRMKAEIAELVSEAASEESRVDGLVTMESYEAEILAALYDDLATPVALTTMQRALADATLPVMGKLALIKQFDTVFGLDLLDQGDSTVEPEVSGEALALLKEREAARARCEWSVADALRGRIRELGYLVEDTLDGPQLQQVRS